MRDWSRFDWETFVEHMVEFRRGIRAEEDVIYSSAELTEYIKWIKQNDELAVAKFNVLMYFGGDKRMGTKDILYYMNHLEEARNYIEKARLQFTAN